MKVPQVYYYISPSGQNPVREFILKPEKHQQAKVRRLLELIDKYGIDQIPRHVKKLAGTPLWEIRIVGKNNIRILYATITNNNILVLNGFIKKTQKTPLKEIRTSLERLSDWKNS